MGTSKFEFHTSPDNIADRLVALMNALRVVADQDGLIAPRFDLPDRAFVPGA